MVRKMENLWLFLATTVIYWVILCIFEDIGPFDIHVWGRLAIVALLCLPININGNIFTIFGNATGKNVFAVF